MLRLKERGQVILRKNKSQGERTKSLIFMSNLYQDSEKKKWRESDSSTQWLVCLILFGIIRDESVALNTS